MDEEKRLKRLEYYREWNAANKERRRETRKAWADANKERLKESARVRAKTPEALKKSREWAWNYREANRERLNERERLRGQKKRLENPGHYSHFCRSYKDAIRQATPAWLSIQQIAEMEIMKVQAKMATALFKIKIAVDHSVPLQSPSVCGLHVPWNLTLTTSSANSRKSNKSWPDMWEIES